MTTLIMSDTKGRKDGELALNFSFTSKLREVMLDMPKRFNQRFTMILMTLLSGSIAINSPSATIGDVVHPQEGQGRENKSHQGKEIHWNMREAKFSLGVSNVIFKPSVVFYRVSV